MQSDSPLDPHLLRPWTQYILHLMQTPLLQRPHPALLKFPQLPPTLHKTQEMPTFTLPRHIRLAVAGVFDRFVSYYEGT
jgi:hypothetical protein